MSTFKTNITVVGSVTATTVNGIVGLNDNDGLIQPNGTADSGTSNYAARADHVHADSGGSSGDKFTFVLHVGEDATTGVNKTNVLICTKSLTITKVYAVAVSPPSGASLLFDINKNGTTIWQTQSNRLAIASGQYFGNQIYFDTTSLEENDVLSIDIDQVGSIEPGGNITVILVCN